jgi:hypothetical protein
MAEENPFSVLFNKSVPTDGKLLAVLQPGNRDDALKVSLKQCQDTPYECIGYDRTSTEGISAVDVDGQTHPIPRPLEEALRALRYPDKDRHVWADILIGTSAEELNRQSAATKSMLQNASRLIAWLGPGNPTFATAFDILQVLAHRWQQAALHANMPPNWAQSRPDQWITAREKLLSFPPEPLQPENVDAWKAMDEVFASAYFESARAIPELVLAPETTLVHGDRTIEWKDFLAASRAHVIALAGLKGEAPSEKLMKAFQLINSHETAVWRYRNDDGLELLPMIQSSRDCSSIDPREFVFAMLPITRPSKRKGTNPDKPVPDYTKDVQTVFKEAAKYVVLERQDLLLWWCERPPCGRRLNGLPSWVPDWSVPNPKTGYFVSPNNKMRGWADSLPAPKTITVDDDDRLHVQAHALDRIDTVSPIFTEENYRKLVLSEWQRVPSTAGDTPQTKADRFWRTLVLDHAGLGETRDKAAKPPPELFESWRSLIAEEQILKLMDCTIEEFMSSPELQIRARNDPNVAQLGALAGQSNTFEGLLRKNALGRRFFTTASGRTGMTAIERRDNIDTSEDAPPVPNFDDALGDSMFHDMMQAFQGYGKKALSITPIQRTAGHISVRLTE